MSNTVANRPRTRAVIMALVVVGALLVPLGAAQATDPQCDTRTPPVTGTSVGVDLPDARLPGIPPSVPVRTLGSDTVLLCLSPWPSSLYALSDQVVTGGEVGPGGGWAGVGNTGMLCHHSLDSIHYWCTWVGVGSSVTATGEYVIVGGSASVCDGNEKWIYPHCTGVLATVIVDGPGGATMGVGAVAAACDSFDKFTCYPQDLALPGSVWIDLTEHRNNLRRFLVNMCGRGC